MSLTQSGNARDIGNNKRFPDTNFGIGSEERFPQYILMTNYQLPIRWNCHLILS
jgi:hypothetical protein